MRNSELILNNLCLHSKVSDYKYERLYRILFNEEMFYDAYQNIYAKPGNMTPGVNGSTIDQMNIRRISKLIESLKDESYKPCPAKRVYIPKKNGKLRPLGIPSFEDKLVQEVTRTILEAIYEGYFESTSHGFRPAKSCHTALTDIKKLYTGTRWFIEGDIKGFFDNIDHNILINILRERISDERFLRLIRKFLKAGYMEKWKFRNTYSGTPQGGIISPILANIYLDKFDKYIKMYADNFNKGTKRRPIPETSMFRNTMFQMRQEYRETENESRKKEIKMQMNKLIRERNEMPASIEMDETFRRLRYVRYADDFLIGVIGTKAECIKIKADITRFMEEQLHLELSDEKTLITHGQEAAKFLGFEISMRKSSACMKRDHRGYPARRFNGKVMLRVSPDTLEKRLKGYDAIEYVKDVRGNYTWRGKERGALIHKQPHEILSQYNSEIRGFYNYYCIADNISSIGNSFKYIMEYSMYKTLGNKLRSPMSKVIKKYFTGGKFVIPYKDNKGKEKYVVLYEDGFKRKPPTKFNDCDNLPHGMKHYKPSHTLVERLMNEECELCGAYGPLTMHHIRNLKSASIDTEWGRKMLKMQRKTLAVCERCNQRIQSYGK